MDCLAYPTHPTVCTPPPVGGGLRSAAPSCAVDASKATNLKYEIYEKIIRRTVFSYGGVITVTGIKNR